MEQHLSQYRIFYEVARCGNISRAAKNLYISQPAISKSVSKLEESLGTKLFTRSSRGVRLTPEGRILYEHIDSAFNEISQGENELRRIKDFHLGQLRIGVSNTLCRYVLLPYLKGFVEKYPHVTISIDSQPTARTLEMLESGKIELGLVARPKNPHGLKFEPVMSIHDCFVCTPSYLNNLRLREGGEPDIFSSGNIILLDKSNVSREHIDEWLAENQINIRHLSEATDMALLIDFAKIGLGIVSVVREFVADELAAGSLIEIPLSSPISGRDIGFARTASEMSDTLRDFLDFCKEFNSGNGAGIS